MVGGGWLSLENAPTLVFWFVVAMFVAGLVQLKLSLWRAIREVNQSDSAPDTTEWQIGE